MRVQSPPMYSNDQILDPEIKEMFMEKKWIPVIAVGGALLIISALCALTVFGTFIWLRDNVEGEDLFVAYKFNAEAIETQSFDAAEIDSIQLTSKRGNITIIGAETDKILVEMTKKAAASSEEEAQQKAESILVDFTQSGNMLEITYAPLDDGRIRLYNRPSDVVDFTITLPYDLGIDVDLQAGDVTVEEIDGAVQVEVDFGEIEIEDLSGPVNISSKNGDISAMNIDAEDTVITSEFGSITIENLQADSLIVETHNGAILATDIILQNDFNTTTQFGNITVEHFNSKNLSVTSENGAISLAGGTIDSGLSVESQFGNITLENIDSDILTIISHNGEIKLTDSTIDSGITIENQFGDIKTTNTAASNYDLQTEGDINLDSVSGPVKAHSDFGSITIQNGTNTKLDLYSQNGDIEYQGTLAADKDHLIESEFGTITLSIPTDSAFDISFKTEYGKIQSEIPIEMSGSFNEKIWEGAMNNGGNELIIKTDNGNILISTLE
jgi:DUF4097 and DUF4098 domain-containing protein YvlB